MYGGNEKSEAQKKADDEFIASLDRQGVSRADGAKLAVRRGWEFFHKSDFPTATQRFNQAWLLDPENGDAYHGFALVTASRRGPAKDVETFFLLALSKPKVHISAHVDYGRFLWMQNRFEESLRQLHKTLDIDPKAREARSHIAFVHYRQSNYVRACDWSKKAKDNGDGLEPGFLEDMCRRASR